MVSQKKITFNTGEQAKVWNFTYPSYEGATSGTTHIQGPEFNTDVTHYAYDSTCPWKIGLIGTRSLGDGSYSETYDWTYQEISDQIWNILGTSMGKAKAPLLSSVIESRTGDATSKVEYLYERIATKSYGLPTKINYYANGLGALKSYRELSYYFESHTNFYFMYMLAFIASDTHYSGSGTILKKTTISYYEESGKWGAIKQVKKLKSGTTYYTWDYGYDGTNPNFITVTIDHPGNAGIQTIKYSWGVVSEINGPGIPMITRTISQYDSSVLSETNQHGGTMVYSYDDIGRVISIDMPGSYNDIYLTWRPNNENKVVITRGGNTVTKYWDGMGRETGYTESGDNTTLYLRNTLDAECRVRDENIGSIDPSHKYSYVLNAAGQVTQITDPMNKVTTISYSGNAATVTDPETHVTVYEYNDLPGLPTKLTDAQNHVTNYTYDPIGRLTTVVFNSARTHSFEYDGLDNVTSETHPETGIINYVYNTENKLSQKTWGGIMHSYNYNSLGQLSNFYSGEEWTFYEYDDSRRVNSISGGKGWSRNNITYNVFGSVTGETLTIPGLPSKSLSYTYDNNNNQSGITYPDGKSVTTSYNGLNMPESLTFNSKLLVSDMSYGPNRMPTSMTIAGNGTAFTATYSGSGLLNTATLKKDSTTLYDASYTYDGLGNILSISSTAPTPSLSASFGYDSLYRLTSATYSSGRVSNFVYEFDEYGNMKTVKENEATVFSKTYDSNNKITDYNYDARGNLTSAGGNIYSWDNQNRLKNVKNNAGEVLGKYLYDGRGLRLKAVPPTPEININHDTNDIPDGGCARFSCSVGSYIDQTFTVENLGDANLILSGSPVIIIAGPNADQFSVQQQPGSPVSPSGTTTFIIRFQPTFPGIKTAAISIANNDVDENPYDIALYGNFEPEIDIWQAFDGESWDFGTVMIGDFWQETFTIKNLGNDDLILSGSPIVSITGPDKYQFSVQQQPSSLIPPGGTTTFVIRFAPMSEGLKTAAISIANNDWNENPYDITLLGTGDSAPPVMVDVPSLIITFPNGGEKIQAGSLQTITWTAEDARQDVKIEYSADNGSTYQTIIERTPNTGSYQWKVPQDISSSCLIRISNADGYPIMPEMLSYEFKFKISKPQTTVQQAAHFMIHAGVPDIKTMSYWAADISFVPDELKGNENMVFNYVQEECQSPELFFENWHHVRIHFDLNNYSGSAWMDDRIIVENTPLSMSLNADSASVISMSCGAEIPVKIWVEDLEVKYLDLNLKPQNEEDEPIIKPLIKDSFDKYESGLFPEKGGWLIRREMINGDERKINIDIEEIGKEKEGGRLPASPHDVQSRGNSLIDDKEYVSAPKSFKLESLSGRPVSVVKRFSLPDRIPFDISDDNFAITLEGPEERRDEVKMVLLDQEPGAMKESWWSKKANDISSMQRFFSSNKKKAEIDQGLGGITPNQDTPTIKTLSAYPAVGTFYIYSFDGKLLSEYGIYGTCLKDYIYMGDRLIAEYRPQEDKYYYYTSDQINSTRIVTNDSGEVVYSAAYDPYGGIQKTWVNTYDPALKFSRKERDAESGLDYFGARYYDKAQYRFISVDPVTTSRGVIDDPQLWNLYSYCRNNPITFLDMEGKSIEKITLILKLIRTDYTSTETRGYLMYEDVFLGLTLELPWRDNKNEISCIKEGVYELSLFKKQNGTWVVRLEDKNGRTLVNIEIANEVSELEGCIALGLGLDPKTGNLTDSEKAVGGLVSCIDTYDFWYWWWDFYTKWVLEITYRAPIAVVTTTYSIIGYTY